MTTQPEHATNTDTYRQAYDTFANTLTAAERAHVVAAVDQLDSLVLELVDESARALNHIARGEIDAAHEHGERLKARLDALKPGELVDVAGRLTVIAAGYAYADQIGQK